MLFNDGNKLQFRNWIFKVTRTSMKIKVIKKVIHRTFSLTLSLLESGEESVQTTSQLERKVTSYMEMNFPFRN